MNGFKTLVFVALSAAWSTQASARQYAWCQVDAGESRYLSGIIEIEAGGQSLNELESDPWSEAFEAHVKALTGRRGVGHADCWGKKSLREAHSFIRMIISANPDFDWRQTGWLGGRPGAAEGAPVQSRRSGVSISTGTGKPATASEPEAPVRPKKSNAQADAEYAAALAEHEREMAAHRQRLEDYRRAQDEVARIKEEQRLAVERKMDSFKRVLAEHERRQLEYQASEARHRKCVAGDQQACADIRAGKPALADQQQQLADAGPASTDTDPNRCVTTAELRLNATFEGNTSASVVNGCGQEVDVRICLKRGSDWNCGVDLGVGPQEQAVHSSFNATGEVFVDARIAGSSTSFADPPS